MGFSFPHKGKNKRLFINIKSNNEIPKQTLRFIEQDSTQLDKNVFSSNSHKYLLLRTLSQIRTYVVRIKSTCFLSHTKNFGSP